MCKEQNSLRTANADSFTLTLQVHEEIFVCAEHHLTMVSLLSPGLPPLSLQDILDHAGRLVDKHLQDDRSYLDLVDQLNVPSESKVFSF